MTDTAPADTAAPGPGPEVSNESGDVTFDFPANTPVADMTPEQQAEYWREKAQKHEKQWRSVSEKTDADLRKELSKAKRELDQARQASMTEQERAVEAAKADGFNAGRAEGLGQLVAAEIRAAAAGRLAPEAVAALVGGLNLGSFVDEEGQVDQAKVTGFVDSVAPPVETKTDPFANLDFGQGTRTRDSDPLALNGDPLLKAVTDRLKR